MLLKRNNQETVFLSKITVLIAAIAIIIGIVYVDVPLAQYFENVSSQARQAAKMASALLIAEYNLYIWSLLFFFCRFVIKNPRWGNRMILVLVSIPLAGVVCGVIKLILGRSRPELLFSEHVYAFTFHGWSYLYTSFPSNHATTAGAICGAFSAFYPRWSIPLMLLGLVIGLSRVVLNAHFFTDVIAGLTIGLISSQWIYTLMKKKNVYGTSI